MQYTQVCARLGPTTSLTKYGCMTKHACTGLGKFLSLDGLGEDTLTDDLTTLLNLGTAVMTEEILQLYSLRLQ